MTVGDGGVSDGLQGDGQLLEPPLPSLAALGIPSRVAVGYTPGALQPDGWYVVIGRDSHAWPEVWFDGLGWIPFEPTPHRTLPLDPAQGSSLEALRIMPVT